ncbi:MAG: zinc ribbon domain-containing protein [Nanoarchaeota archaeon]|mgnify:CR=1 FL=1
MTEDFIEAAIGCLILVGMKLSREPKDIEKAKTQAGMVSSFLATANLLQLSKQAGKIITHLEKNEVSQALEIQRKLLAELNQVATVENEDKKNSRGHIALVRYGLICPKCKTDNRLDSNFCKECGTKFEKKICHNCQTSNRSGSTFCTKCGTKL